MSSEGRFLDSLASQCDELVCFLHEPRREEERQLDCEMRAPNVRWVSFGPHASTPYRTFFSDRFTRPLLRWRNRLDALLIRGPSPLLPAVGKFARGHVPLALLLVGDYPSVVDDLPQPLWRREAIRCWALWNRRQQEAVARRALTMVNSEELHQRWQARLPNLVSVRTTNLSNTDFHARGDVGTREPYRLLYAGRMDRGKGLLVLVEALAGLVRLGDDVRLDLVGPTQPRDRVLHDLACLAALQGVADRIEYHGSRPVGPELFAFHRRSDVFVNASLRTEGFPRAIWEAQANSLPVVATRVGAIPLVLRDRESARLVEPRSVSALGEGIRDVLHDQTLRKRLISNGLKMAADNTLEKRTYELAGLLKDWVRDPRSRVQ
jgi:glycosyltransferase involved in cell wall biosynthesis